MTERSPDLVTGTAGVPIDTYDAIELLSEVNDHPSRLLSAAARKVADLWNDPPLVWQRDLVEQHFPELGDALYELLGGGPSHPPTTWNDVRTAPPEAGRG